MSCPLCINSLPEISQLIIQKNNVFFAKHCCSQCALPLFEVEINPGMQLIATREIHNHEKTYTIPKGRLLRLSAFSELSSNVIGFVFAGLFGAGAFEPNGFAARWDINKIISQEG